jgi:hypothetical protein
MCHSKCTVGSSASPKLGRSGQQWHELAAAHLLLHVQVQQMAVEQQLAQPGFAVTDSSKHQAKKARLDRMSQVWDWLQDAGSSAAAAAAADGAAPAAAAAAAEDAAADMQEAAAGQQQPQEQQQQNCVGAQQHEHQQQQGSDKQASPVHQPLPQQDLQQETLPQQGLPQQAFVQ